MAIFNRLWGKVMARVGFVVKEGQPIRERPGLIYGLAESSPQLGQLQQRRRLVGRVQARPDDFTVDLESPKEHPAGHVLHEPRVIVKGAPLAIRACGDV